jgi:hypothetical protein
MKGANKTAFNESAGYLFTMNEEFISWALLQTC